MSAKHSALDAIRERFPNLSDKAKITSPETSKYNCIAYAAGDLERWWWPDTLHMDYWPAGCPRTEAIAAFQVAFETLGYQPCANADFDLSVEKIAIFHKNNVPTHAAKQIANRVWSSKLGQSFDISHEINCLSGADEHTYGEIALFMCRLRS